MTESQLRSIETYSTEPRRFQLPPRLKEALRCASVTVEVFLHHRVGVEYLSPARILGGVAFLLLCVLLCGLGMTFKPSTISGFVWLIPHFEWPESPATLQRRLGIHFWDSVRGMQEQSTRSWPSYLASGEVAVSVKVMLLFLLVSVFHLIRELLMRPYTPIEEHAWSDGETLWIWGWIYHLQEKLLIRVDLVKGIVEPMLCWGLAHWMIRTPETHYLGIWLFLTAPLLSLKAWEDNRTRRREKLEQGAMEHKQVALQSGDAIKPRSPQPEKIEEIRGSEQPEA